MKLMMYAAVNMNKNICIPLNALYRATNEYAPPPIILSIYFFRTNTMPITPIVTITVITIIAILYIFSVTVIPLVNSWLPSTSAILLVPSRIFLM